MTSAPPSAPQRRPDESMSLLRVVTEEAVDPDYARAAAGPPRPRAWLSLLVVMVVTGALFAVAAAQTTAQQPAIANEREELIRHIDAAQQRQGELQVSLQRVGAEVRHLEDEALSRAEDDGTLTAERDRLEPLAGSGVVRGPGMVITVDDAPGGDVDQRVVDTDLQHLANGLWASGAEAIAINGHRLSSLTAIRGAGESITVDYRSLTRPYVIEAIGNPETLPAEFADSSGGQWWAYVTQNFGLRFDTQTADHLELAADPGQDLLHARKGPN